MSALLRGCLGILAFLAGLIALAVAAALLADGASSRGLGAVLLLVALACGMAAARSLRTGLRMATGAPTGRPGQLPGPPRGAGGSLAALALVVAAGTAVSLAGPAGLVLLVPLHVAAALLPARILTRHAAALQGGAPRGLVGRALVWGGLGATSLAFVGELILGIALGLVVWIALGTTPGAREAVADAFVRLAAALTGSGADPADALASLELGTLLRPSIAAAIVGLLGLAGPLIEELAKLLGVALLRPRTRPAAFLAGVASGAGFGALEGLLAGAAVTGPAWGLGIVARAAATLMHAATCGIAALGWYELGRGAAGRGVQRIGLAVALHAVWNLGVVGAVLAGSAAAEGIGPDHLAVVAQLSPLLVSGAFAFVLFAYTGTARRLGREAADAQPAATSAGR